MIGSDTSGRDWLIQATCRHTGDRGRKRGDFHEKRKVSGNVWPIALLCRVHTVVLAEPEPEPEHNRLKLWLWNLLLSGWNVWCCCQVTLSCLTCHHHHKPNPREMFHCYCEHAGVVDLFYLSLSYSHSYSHSLCECDTSGWDWQIVIGS